MGKKLFKILTFFRFVWSICNQNMHQPSCFHFFRPKHHVSKPQDKRNVLHLRVDLTRIDALNDNWDETFTWKIFSQNNLYQILQRQIQDFFMRIKLWYNTWTLDNLRILIRTISNIVHTGMTKNLTKLDIHQDFQLLY